MNKILMVQTTSGSILLVLPDGKGGVVYRQLNGEIYSGSCENLELYCCEGVDGADGLSAYEIAVNNGFTGTETEWLDSLIGNDGVDGTDGLSAYDIWINQGNTGTEQDFLDSLIGPPGVDGQDGNDGLDGADGNTPQPIWTGTELAWDLDGDGNADTTPVDLQGPPGTGGGSGIQSIQAGTNVSVDNTDPLNPIINAAGGSGGDNWGTQVVETDGTINGNGTIGDPLGLCTPQYASDSDAKNGGLGYGETYFNTTTNCLKSVCCSLQEVCIWCANDDTSEAKRFGEVVGMFYDPDLNLFYGKSDGTDVKDMTNVQYYFVDCNSCERIIVTSEFTDLYSTWNLVDCNNDVIDTLSGSNSFADFLTYLGLTFTNITSDILNSSTGSTLTYIRVDNWDEQYPNVCLPLHPTRGFNGSPFYATNTTGIGSNGTRSFTTSGNCHENRFPNLELNINGSDIELLSNGVVIDQVTVSNGSSSNFKEILKTSITDVLPNTRETIFTVPSSLLTTDAYKFQADVYVTKINKQIGETLRLYAEDSSGVVLGETYIQDFIEGGDLTLKLDFILDNVSNGGVNVYLESHGANTSVTNILDYGPQNGGGGVGSLNKPSTVLRFYKI